MKANRLALAAILAMTSGLMATPVSAFGVGAQGIFSASKAGGKARLGGISAKNLSAGSQIDNINQLFQVGVAENQISVEQVALFAPRLKTLERGDEVLLSCLQMEHCNLGKAIQIASASHLHREIFVRSAPSSLVAANKLVGNVSEGLMHKSFTSTGWKWLNGEVGVNGIDGLYVKRNRAGNVVDVLIAESKYNRSGLGDTRNGQQMSKEWILGNLRKLMARYPEATEYRQIERHVINGNYRARFWKVRYVDDRLIFDVTKVHSKSRETQTAPFSGGEHINSTFQSNREIYVREPQNRYQGMIAQEFFRLLGE